MCWVTLVMLQFFWRSVCDLEVRNFLRGEARRTVFSSKDIATHWWKYFVTLPTGTLYAVNEHLAGLERREFLCSDARILLCFLATSALSRWTIVSLCVIPFSSYDNFFFILFSLICFLKRFNCDIVATTRRWQMYTLFLSLNVTCEVPRSMMVYGSNRPWLYIFFPNKKCSLLAYHCHRAFS